MIQRGSESVTMLALAVLFLVAACGVADPRATDVEPQLRGCGPAPQDGFQSSCWWAEEDIILRVGIPFKLQNV